MDSPKGNCISTVDLNWDRKILIGEGKFGSLHQTVWSVRDDEEGTDEDYTMAVKSPHGVNRETIFAERDIKSELRHKNIVNIFGFVQLNHNHKVALVFEYTEKDTVYDYIWQRRDKGGATADMMMGIAYDIAKGMKYLHANSYVHGDLALHNCIIYADGNVKVGDLGFYEARNETCYFSDSNVNTRLPCPVRWMAPENLPYKYSTKPQMVRKEHTKSYTGDIWAFGVVLYELWTRGAHPFDGCDDDQLVCKHVLDGGTAASWNSRFKMRSSIKNLMQSCWELIPNERPAFSCIVSDFENWMGDGSDENMDSDSGDENEDSGEHEDSHECDECMDSHSDDDDDEYEEYADLDQSQMTCPIMNFK